MRTFQVWSGDHKPEDPHIVHAKDLDSALSAISHRLPVLCNEAGGEDCFTVHVQEEGGQTTELECVRDHSFWCQGNHSLEWPLGQFKAGDTVRSVLHDMGNWPWFLIKSLLEKGETSRAKELLDQTWERAEQARKALKALIEPEPVKP